jgi:hypothetical protein
MQQRWTQRPGISSAVKMVRISGAENAGSQQVRRPKIAEVVRLMWEVIFGPQAFCELEMSIRSQEELPVKSFLSARRCAPPEPLVYRTGCQIDRWLDPASFTGEAGFRLLSIAL